MQKRVLAAQRQAGARQQQWEAHNVPWSKRQGNNLCPSHQRPVKRGSPVGGAEYKGAFDGNDASLQGCHWQFDNRRAQRHVHSMPAKCAEGGCSPSRDRAVNFVQRPLFQGVRLTGQQHHSGVGDTRRSALTCRIHVAARSIFLLLEERVDLAWGGIGPRSTRFGHAPSKRRREGSLKAVSRYWLDEWGETVFRFPGPHCAVRLRRFEVVR